VQFSNNAFKYMAFGDPAYDVLKMDLGAERTRAVAKIGAVIDAASPDLRAFKARGGKLIQYHGWNDPAIPAGSSIVYYEDVQRTIGDPSGFYRLYMIPGMLHCAGGAGPSGVDWIAALDRWVTQGQAPEAVVAAAPPKTEGAAPETQLLCPYPAVAEGGACKPRGRSRRG
jgi:feruloyl esterase